MNERKFARLEALYWYAVDNHGGQRSRLYRIQCRIWSHYRYRPGRLHRGYDSLPEDSKAIYDDLQDRNVE